MESNKKILLSVVFVAIMVVLACGITFAFFNYTRTGLANNIRVGRIYFNTSQNGNINLSNVSPITSAELDSDQNNHDSVTITITGNTTYDDGVEYLITFVDVNNTVNNKEISIAFEVESTGIGDESADYYNERGGDDSIYLLTDEGVVSEDKYILNGYIAKGETGIDGSITITAYVDADKIAVTNTYVPQDPNYAINPNMTQTEINACVSYITSQNWSWNTGETVEDFCDGTGTNYNNTFQTFLNNSWFSDEDIEYFAGHGIFIDTNDYSGSTSPLWVNGRTVFSTSEWNSLQGNNSLSFKVKVEANEGIWVDREATSGRCFSTQLQKIYTPNSNLTQTEINVCVDYLSQLYFFSNSGYEEIADFCAGTGTVHNQTFQVWLYDLYSDYYDSILSDLESYNIITPTNIGVNIYDYDEDCGTDIIVPNKIKYTLLSYNSNMTQEEINTCASFVSSLDWTWDSEESPQDYCEGTGTHWSWDFQKTLDDRTAFPFSYEELAYLVEHNIVLKEEIVYPVLSIGTNSGSLFDSPSTLIFNDNLKIISNSIIDNPFMYPTEIVIPESVVYIGSRAFAHMTDAPNQSTFTILGNPYVESGALPPYSEIRYGGTCSELTRFTDRVIYAFDGDYTVITSDNNSCPVDYYYDD